MVADHAKITQGGDRLDLLMQLADIGRTKARPLMRLVLEFVSADSRTHVVQVDVYIDGIASRAGDGHKWLITGRVHGSYLQAHPGLRVILRGQDTFKGTYDTENREGVIQPGSWWG